MCKRVLMFLFLGVLLISTLSAAEYYVSPTGTASWANCQSETPLSGTECCSLSTANTNLQPGDTVYFREGIYNTVQQYGVGLDITNKQGNLDNRIILQNYNNELVEFKGIYGVRQWGFMIQSSSYIQLKGFIFSDYSDYLTRHFSNHIEITECTFRNTVSPYKGGSVQFVESCIGGSSVQCPVNNIWFHNNILYKLTAGGGCSGGTISEGGDSFRIGYHSGICYSGECAEGLNSHFTVENNYMAYAGHAVMDSYSIYSVFRNNIAHNEPWYPADNGDCQVTYLPEYTNENYNGLYSHRVWAITDTFSRDYSYNLIENNRLGHAGVNPNNDGSTGLVIASPGNIIRYNSAYGTMNSPMKTKWGDDIGWQSNGGTRNRIYSNTIYTGGYGYPYFQTCTNQQLSTCPKPLVGFRWYYPHNSAGNHLKNNIVYGSYGAVEKNLKDIQDDTSGVIYSNNLCTNVDLAKCSVVGDPLFINPDLSDTTSHTLPNLRLQSNSPAIDAGIHLTLSTNSGSNSINLVVENALYFQDGSWGSSLSQGVTHFPDWIAIGNVDNVVQISSINYSSNTITLDSPMTWNDNDLVWLYKKSDGERVLYGSGPDIGAYEFQEDSGEIWAENCSQEAVQQAIDSAEDGDTVRVPAGECVWNQSVKIGEQTNWNPDLYESKEIVLRG